MNSPWPFVRPAYWVILLTLHLRTVFGAETLAVNPSGPTAIAIEALIRLKGIDLETYPAMKTAVMKVLEQVRGTPQFVELVRDFKIKDQSPALLEFAVQHPDDSSGVEAMRLILANQDFALLTNSLAGTDAVNVVEALGNTGEKQIVPLLAPLVTDTKREANLRKQVLRSLARIQDGAAALLKLAREEKLPDDLKFIASAELNNVRWAEIKTEAAKLLPLPQSQNAQPLPPIGDLLKMKGDPARGGEVFARETVGCIKCHQVNGRGTDVGPNLSEIGSKLGKDALFESILDPNAGISFGYEAWQIELKNGDEAFGLIVSESADELAIKAQTGIVTRYQKTDVVKRQQMKTSIMPTGLQQAMSTQDLVDLVEYLSSLKKSANSRLGGKSSPVGFCTTEIPYISEGSTPAHSCRSKMFSILTGLREAMSIGESDERSQPGQYQRLPSVASAAIPPDRLLIATQSV
jgi:putative heme-binding domain-containing protein